MVLDLANFRAVLSLKAAQIMPMIDDVQMTLNLLGWIYKCSCLSVNNKMKHCVSSALLLKYTTNQEFAKSSTRTS